MSPEEAEWLAHLSAHVSVHERLGKWGFVASVTVDGRRRSIHGPAASEQEARIRAVQWLTAQARLNGG